MLTERAAALQGFRSAAAASGDDPSAAWLASMLAPSSRQRTTSSPVAASKNSPVFHPSQESCSPASFTNVSPQASTPRAAAPMLSFTAALRALMGVESAQQVSYPVLSRSWWKQITSTMGVTKVSVPRVRLQHGEGNSIDTYGRSNNRRWPAMATAMGRMRCSWA